MPSEPRPGGLPAQAQGAAARRITLVAAVARNGVIGHGNRLPWHLPADLAHFKRLTLDKPIVMGRRTWESLPGLLPRRRHIVISADPRYRAQGCEVVASPAAALAAAGEVPEVMVVGGATVYAALLPQATHMALTLVHADSTGDVHFPAWSPSAWREIGREHRPADARNAHALDFVVLERRAAD
ncbi:dihydrofolate reductase [Thiohalocapsa halophila]|uniref:Dihydrofolate reductase n=1 Tax=Thiohalocapsa halophila TaxID=69359 RepID=A0ABS1CIN2_9GAMM|nr:dihydrofolate reductase [Thiohalocapsa halophila]MBK1631790.1 dihydrofolate reductase [Thiohalocapsa halophila]